MVLTIGAWWAAAAAEPIVYIGGSGSGISSTLIKVVREAGLWKKHGLEMPTFISRAALCSEEPCCPATSPRPTATFRGSSAWGLGVLDVKVIAVTMNRLDTYFVARIVARPEDLKGKRVGVSRFGSLSDVSTRLLARFWKIDPEKELTILQTGNSPSRVAALVAGHVDGGLMSLTVLDRLLASGCCRVLADLTELPLDYAQFGVAVPTAALERQRI